MLRAESIRWGLAQAEKIYRDDSSAIVMLNITELRSLLALALQGVRPKQKLLGYVASSKHHDSNPCEAIFWYSDWAEFDETASAARAHRRDGKVFKIFAEELGAHARG